MTENKYLSKYDEKIKTCSAIPTNFYRLLGVSFYGSQYSQQNIFINRMIHYVFKIFIFESYFFSVVG